MEKNHVTLRMIAKKAECSLATVSMALRNDPRLLPETVARIHRLAQRMGYVPDREASEVMSRMRISARRDPATILAYIRSDSGIADLEAALENDSYYQGALAEAKRATYRIEVFWLSEEELPPRRLSRVLKTRGIRGLIFSPFPARQEGLDMDWDHFSPVAIGPSLVSPEFNRVNNSQYHVVHLAFQKLTALGYRRIGFITEQLHNKRLSGAFLGAFLAAQYDLPASQKVPALIARDAEWEQDAIDWFQEHRPDAVIGEDIFDLVKSGKLSGISIPENLGIAITNLRSNDPQSGIDQDPVRQGAEALRMVVGQLHRNEFGIPKQSMTHQTSGVWRNGDTTRRIKTRVPKSQHTAKPLHG